MTLHLDPWQQEILAYSGDFVLCTGRQSGKTTVLAIKAALYMLSHPGSRIIIVSLTEDQAKLIIIMILGYLESVDKKKIAKGKYKPTQNRVVLKNGSSALARPVGNTGDAIRGFTGDVLIIDEASRMPELAFEAGMPTLLTTGGQLWVTSTPYGKKGFFYQAFTNKDQTWKVWHIDSESVIHNRAISHSWTQVQRDKAIARLNNQKVLMTKLQYGQEYLGLFVEDLQAFFEEELITQCCTEKRNTHLTGNCYMGVDVARMGSDSSALEVLRAEKDKVWHVENIVLNKLYLPEVEQAVISLDQVWKCKKIGIDAGSGTLGLAVLDYIRLKSGFAYKMVPMNNRKIIIDKDKKEQRMAKVDFYNNLKSMMEHGELKLLDDENVKLSLRSVQWQLKTDVNTRSQIEIFGENHDIVEGLTRAAWLVKKAKPLSLWIDYVR